MRQGKKERGWIKAWIWSKLRCSSQTPITDGYKLQQPVRIKYAMDNWWALDIKSVLVPHSLCVCVHVVLVCMRVCVCACNWWGLDRDTGRPPEEIRATLPRSCRLRKKTIMNPAQLTVHCTFTCSTIMLELQRPSLNKLDVFRHI